MAIDGNWEITINSPMGAQKAKLELTASGGDPDRHPACPGLFPAPGQWQGGRRCRELVGQYHLPHADDPGIQPARWKATRSRAASRPAASVLSPSAAAEPDCSPHQGRPAMMPIHREGWPFIALFAAVNLIAFLMAPLAGLAAAAAHHLVRRLFPRSRTRHPRGREPDHLPRRRQATATGGCGAAGGAGAGRDAAATAFGVHECVQCACEPQSGERHGDRPVPTGRENSSMPPSTRPASTMSACR